MFMQMKSRHRGPPAPPPSKMELGILLSVIIACIVFLIFLFIAKC